MNEWMSANTVLKTLMNIIVSLISIKNNAGCLSARGKVLGQKVRRVLVWGNAFLEFKPTVGIWLMRLGKVPSETENTWWQNPGAFLGLEHGAWGRSSSDKVRSYCPGRVGSPDLWHRELTGRLTGSNSGSCQHIAHWSPSGSGDAHRSPCEWTFAWPPWEITFGSLQATPLIGMEKCKDPHKLLMKYY